MIRLSSPVKKVTDYLIVQRRLLDRRMTEDGNYGAK